MLTLGGKPLQVPILQGGMGVGVSLGGLAGAVACIGGGDAPHAAAGCNGTGQPAEGNAHTHAAL